MNITQEIAQKVLQTVDAGLIRALGNPVPGHMCVEAAAEADEILAEFAEGVVQILIELNAPGVQWLGLTETTR